LIEDLAHSAGAKYPDGREVGTVGDYTILSFSQDKIVDAVSGGALITRTKNSVHVDAVWKRVSFRTQLRDRLYPSFTWKIRNFYSVGIGRVLHYIFRKAHMLSLPLVSLDKNGFEMLPGWYAGLAMYRFLHLDEDVARRRMCMREYLAMLPSELHATVTKESIERASCLRVPLLVENREALILDYKNNGIYISDIWYEVPVSPRRYWNQFEKENRAPNARAVAEKMLNFPTHMTLCSLDIVRIAEQLQTWKSHSAK
jgi:dTDP-4-amino-4,6-dideoxygalactose transaminase